VFLAMPPLYRIRVGSGKKARTHYVFTDEEKNRVLKTCNGKDVDIQRFKGLGEMDAATLKSTTMDPATRTIIRVGLDDDGKADAVFDCLMGKDVKKRFTFIKTHATEVKDLDI
jgi:DNA gyrase/topoisomerase IV subunit B